MNRYHKDVYIPEADGVRLEAWTAKLNAGKWQYSRHCTDNLKLRYIGLTEILVFIKGIKLNASDIFEYYTDENNSFVKTCYRIKYTAGIDIILVLGEDKNIITIYANTADDDHVTLNKNLYVKN
jgi:hypothetical protein